MQRRASNHGLPKSASFTLDPIATHVTTPSKRMRSENTLRKKADTSTEHTDCASLSQASLNSIAISRPVATTHPNSNRRPAHCISSETRISERRNLRKT